MPDAEERDRIREQFEGEPGKALHAERAVNELENARAYGHESDEARARGELDALGYTPRDVRDREAAAAARKEAAAAKKAERDDDGKDERKSAPEGRSATPPAKQSTTSRK